MVQVRCPECGYLQTLSEERFVAISEDYLNCPHCHAKVPKEWRPAPGETVPEETRHKMLAFSRRILNGRNVAREVVYALESLVRHYGAIDETNKALGVGYAQLGDYKKAEGFLRRAYEEFPEDPQVMHGLMETLVEQERFEDAVEVGQTLVRTLGSQARHDDVARFALALKGLGRIDEAKHVLDAFPELDSRNPVVKQARREINRTAKRGLGALFGANGSIRRLLEGATSRSVRKQSVSRGSSTEAHAEQEEPGHAAPFDAEAAPTPARDDVVGPAGRLARMPVLMEYWVYARQTAIPKWEDIRHELADQFEGEQERERTFELLESLVEKDDLAIEYILKQDAQELFDYPEDMIPHNAKDFGDEDRKTLTEAEMIVRVRLSLNEPPDGDYLTFMVSFVESVRGLTHGVVQDAVSHALWGVQNWIESVVQGGRPLVEVHVLLEMLDENGLVWMHTHGMQKFGLPDMEMEGIPTQLVPACRRIIARSVEALRKPNFGDIDLGRPIKLARIPFPVILAFRPPDQEAHFPVGTLRLLPSIPGEDPIGRSALEKAAELLSTPAQRKKNIAQREAPPEPPVRMEEQEASSETELRQRLLSAHEQARKNLSLFKKSFQDRKNADKKIHVVKIGFPVQGGKYEWMWVSVGGWRGGALVGHLQNEPVLRKDLKQGGVVQLSEEEIFDWAIAQDGEVSQGAYTEGILS